MRSFFAYAHFIDNSHCLFSNIFAPTRLAALAIARARFADCEEYMRGISIHEMDE